MKTTATLLYWSKLTNEERIASYTYPKDKTMTFDSRKLVNIEPNNQCKALIPWNKGLSSNIGLRLTSSMLSNLYLTKEAASIFVGSLLGDGNIRKMSANGAPLWRCNVGLVNISYLLWLSVLISAYCPHMPGLVRRRDTSFYCYLTSRAMPCLEPIYQLFISKGKKQITIALAEWIDPLALAIWAMDDGTATPEGFYFCTQSFTKEEHYILQQILFINFGLYSTIHKQGTQYRLYIPARSMRKFRNIVRPYFAPWFMNKLEKGAK